MIETRVEFVPDDEPTEVVQPADSAFDNPASSVASQLAAILGSRSNTALAMRTDEVDASLSQPLSKRVTIGSLVIPDFTDSFPRIGM